MEAMTELTSMMYDRAIGVQSVEEAQKILRESGQFRTLGDILKSFSGCENPKPLLVEGLMKNNPEANRESMNRKVSNWLNGKNSAISKEDAFILCQILRLPLDKADAFLKMVTGEGIHWRDPEEIIWGYAIFRGLDYAQTEALLRQFRAGKKQTIPASASNPESFTSDVRRKLGPMLYASPEELLEHLFREENNLGSFHNTAYHLFKKYMELLETAGKADKDSAEAKMTSREILEIYLFRQLVPVAKRSDKKERDAFSDVQRSIRMNWPSEATISKMKTRELDVTRKVLILLFLATDGSETEFQELDEDEDILTRDEIFQNIHTRLNRMLQACGFQLLDPRSPFDWMVLYCICVDDLWDVDTRLKDMLAATFPDGKEKQ